jgi:DNA-binding NtrC family response regulator
MTKDKLQQKVLKRAIVIDDDKSLRAAISSILKKQGYEVHASREPFSCPIYLDCACQCPTEHACTNIIITDVNLPNMTGLEFVKSQKQHGCKVQNICVISAVWNETALKSFEDLGCKIFTKPFKMDELTKWLDECETNTEPSLKLSELPRNI